ncbi:MAG TPA: dihydroorotate dehydrogenase electron transfer subunit [Thermoplasmata archaeon]|nr:dihydroorotate dehydrogenase electron transfer subunit [Thermoplasmata archaeon]
MRTIVRVTERVVETPSTVTLRFEDPTPAAPGQFVMVWVPGDDELPMSLSFVGPRKGVTVKAMGDTSRRILGIPLGARLGIRGPFGSKFDVSPRQILLVGGGSGTAVLAPAAELALGFGSSVTAALGATTASELLFEGRLRGAGATVHVATDDGTAGQRGYVTGLVGGLLQERRYDAVWTCGPEVMMQKVAEAGRAAGVPVVFSVERHMKCALGMCDACALGPYHVCVDGPVFPAETISPLPEFGRWKRDPSGRLVPA